MLEIDDLTIDYETDEQVIRAVDGVSLDVDDDEIVGIVGESGCGKSTLIKAIQRILSGNARIPSGSIDYKGENILDLDLTEFRDDYSLQKISTIPQASMDSLDPIYTIRSQLEESMQVHRESLSKSEMTERIETRVRNMGLDASILDKYPHELSGGQVQRVLIANSFLLEPDLVLADEPTTGLDLLTKVRILQWLKDLQNEHGFSLVLISHDLPLVAQMSDKLGVMYAGDIVEFGDVEDVFHEPSHPYTMGLVESTTHIQKERDSGHIPGSPPTISADHEGCKFRDRCPFSFEECAVDPPMKGDEHRTACHLSAAEIEQARNDAHEVYTAHDD